MADPRRSDVLVVGAGDDGTAAAQRLLEHDRDVQVLDKDPKADPALPPHVLRSGWMVVDVVPARSHDGRAAGVVAIDHDGEREVLRTRAVVLATGGIAGLYEDGSDHATGDGLVLAHKAGADVDLRLQGFGDPAPRLASGVLADDAGRTRVPGLVAVGELAGDVDPRAAADALAADLADVPRRLDLTDLHLPPDIDSPLPEGFTRVKLDRLRATMTRHLGPEGPRDLERARVRLHGLKGEADAFDRARLDPELWSLGFATRVALMVLQAAQAGTRDAPSPP